MDKKYQDKKVGDLLEGKIEVIKNKHINGYAQSKIDKLNKQILELILENAELKDMVLDNGGEYADNIRILTDGYEVGSPSEYEEDKQLNIFESPDGGKTIYSRRAGDTERTVVDTSQMSLFND
jgi:hypothetical protein